MQIPLPKKELSFSLPPKQLLNTKGRDMWIWSINNWEFPSRYKENESLALRAHDFPMHFTKSLITSFPVSLTIFYTFSTDSEDTGSAE
jgi:hypothetical protein